MPLVCQVDSSVPTCPPPSLRSECPSLPQLSLVAPLRETYAGDTENLQGLLVGIVAEGHVFWGLDWQLLECLYALLGYVTLRRGFAWFLTGRRDLWV